MLEEGETVIPDLHPWPSKCHHCDEVDGEEVEVVPNSICHQYIASFSQTPSKRFQKQVIPSTPRNLQPILSTIPSSIPPASPNISTSRPALVSPVRPSPIPHPKNSPTITSPNYNLGPVPVEEEKINHHYRFLPPKYFSKGNVGICGLPEKIQIWAMKTKIMWPDCLE
ncbi:hypothetical protein O181_096922 [Austropuccinia psidii MF-1]|uniref:Uncharacterized protein n=1 Tax=Austropuccinia psidii MF-1 TaxID=1389203 RepID=A0A9Q3J885_9BASI|nr:hypothetical protein [Austropuccinia psidii MF-1]